MVAVVVRLFLTLFLGQSSYGRLLQLSCLGVKVVQRKLDTEHPTLFIEIQICLPKWGFQNLSKLNIVVVLVLAFVNFGLEANLQFFLIFFVFYILENLK